MAPALPLYVIYIHTYIHIRLLHRMTERICTRCLVMMLVTSTGVRGGTVVSLITDAIVFTGI